MNMKVYLSGPMRGHQNWNREAFEQAQAKWESHGHQVFSPVTIAIALGYWPPTGRWSECEPDTVEGKAHLTHVMASDIACIMACDLVALLYGWEHSRGCTVEVALAQFMGLDLYDADSMTKLNIHKAPWSVPGNHQFTELKKMLTDTQDIANRMADLNQAIAQYLHTRHKAQTS